ncbi:PfkB family carbohydrate kinase, partial [Escherichia coli]|uniref:PfkB family carbohydrate kinase n=1 Tax=Escherichia coli TaxID=562 RepID=UPI000AF3E2F3
MSRRVATITLNPAYDLVGFCPEIERGEVNLVKTTGLHAAGKGINVAKVLKDLGIDVTVGGFLGKDNQDGFQQLFSELGIANRFQVVQGRTRINVKLTEKDGEVTEPAQRISHKAFPVGGGDFKTREVEVGHFAVFFRQLNVNSSAPLYNLEKMS